jgi:hypothetical protein
MRTSFHHQPEAQHPNFQLSTSWQADYPIFWQILLQKSAVIAASCCLDLSQRFSPSALCGAVTLDQTALIHDMG